MLERRINSWTTTTKRKLQLLQLQLELPPLLLLLCEPEEEIRWEEDLPNLCLLAGVREEEEGVELELGESDSGEDREDREGELDRFSSYPSISSLEELVLSSERRD